MFHLTQAPIFAHRRVSESGDVVIECPEQQEYSLALVSIFIGHVDARVPPVRLLFRRSSTSSLRVLHADTMLFELAPVVTDDSGRGRLLAAMFFACQHLQPLTFGHRFRRRLGNQPRYAARLENPFTGSRLARFDVLAQATVMCLLLEVQAEILKI